MNSRLRSVRVLLLSLLVLLVVPMAGAPPAVAEQVGPGHVAVPGFSGYVTRGGAELGVGLLRDGGVGICLDTGPGLRWPSRTPSYRTVLDARAGYLTATYLGRARHDAPVAAALWWTVGGTLGLNSHPERVRAHVTALRAEAPRMYAAVRAWHERMVAAATRDAAGVHGYTTRLRLRLTETGRRPLARLSGIGVRSGSGHWVAGRRVLIRLSGARFTNGRANWHGSTAAAARSLSIRPVPGRRVRVDETVVGLPSARFRRYDAGDENQRVATTAPRVRIRATATLPVVPKPPVPPVRVRIVKTAELADPAGMIGVAVAVHAGTLTGPVLDRHTFTAGDVRAGVASYTTAARYDRRKRYLVTIIAEPAGWIPRAATVRALRHGTGFVAHLVDDRIWQPTLATQASAQVVRPGSALQDRVTISETGGHTLTGAWRLLGPVSPGASGCRGLDWSTAPTAAAGTFRVIGDGTQVVGAHRVERVGCFTYVERIDGDRTTRPVPWTTPGLVEETTLVRSTPQLATTISRRTATAGALVLDRVAVSGLGPDAGPVVGGWQLLGPVAPSKRHDCLRRDWTHARLVAQGTFVIRHDGTITVGRRHLRVGGCYTYRERLEASPVSTGVAWTRPGLVPETVVVGPRQPFVPPHPHVPAGGARPRASHNAASGSVALRSTGLHADLHAVGFRGSTLTPPGDISTAGVWRDGAGLDAVVGTTVLVGHVSDTRDRPGAFRRLWQARPGQRVVTLAANGTRTRWRISRVFLTPKREVPRRLFHQGMARRLVLVTCGNEVHYADGRFHYRSNLVVEAVPQ